MIVLTRVYRAKTDTLSDENEFMKRYEKLPLFRREKTDRLSIFEDKCRSVGAWELLRIALSEHGIKAETEVFSEKENGKPFLVNHPDIFFNLSHSGNTVMCAVSDTEVGCDVQKITSSDLRIADRFFHESEAKALSKISDENERRILFFRMWTLKESYIKATGRGFSLPLRDFCISLENGSIFVTRKNGITDDFSFKEYFTDDGYCCCVCAKSEDFSCLKEVTI